VTDRRRTPGEHEVGQRTQGEDIEPHPVRAGVPDQTPSGAWNASA